MCWANHSACLVKEPAWGTSQSVKSFTALPSGHFIISSSLLLLLSAWTRPIDSIEPHFHFTNYLLLLTIVSLEGIECLQSEHSHLSCSRPLHTLTLIPPIVPSARLGLVCHNVGIYTIALSLQLAELLR